MKRTIFICILLIAAGSSFSQDTAYQNKIEVLKDKFSGHYEQLSYNKLPGSIRTYLEQLYDENSSRTKELFNHSEARFYPKDKRYWIRKLANEYLLTFGHQGMSRHSHSIYFETSQNEIKNVCTWIAPMQREIVEYSNWHIYRDTLLTILDEFSVNNIRLHSFKKLPDFIRHYLNHLYDEKFRISKTHYSAGCGGGIKRKIAYILQCGNDYILSYDHGGNGHHFHSVFFKTNGKEITNIYNVTNSTHKTLTDLVEFIEYGWYTVLTFNEF